VDKDKRKELKRSTWRRRKLLQEKMGLKDKDDEFAKVIEGLPQWKRGKRESVERVKRVERWKGWKGWKR